MSDVKKLIVGIVLVFVGMAMFLSGGGAIPATGVVIGLAGLVLVVYLLATKKV